MIKHRIDVFKDGDWEPGRITFHDGYPLEAGKDVAREFHRVLKRPVRIVLGDEIVTERIEEVERFDQPVEQVA